MLTMSRRQTVLASLCLVVVAFVCMYHATSWRDSRFEESFLSELDLKAGMRDTKNDLYFNAALKYFFSSGVAVPTKVGSADMQFFPSSNDFICLFTDTSLSAKCDPAYRGIDRLSRVDDTTLFEPSADCKSIASWKTPLDDDDSRIRIFDGVYNFVKSCILVTGRVPSAGAGASASATRLVLPRGEYSTKLFLTLRPMFIKAPMSAVYAVDYSSGIDYDSAATGEITIQLTALPASEIDQSGGSDIKTSVDAYTRGTDLNARFPLTLYYLNYLHQVGFVRDTNKSLSDRAVPTSTPLPTKCVTTIIRSDAPDNKNPLGTDATMKVTKNSSTGVTTVRAFESGGATVTIGAPNSGETNIVVATLTANLLIVAAAYSGGRVVVKISPIVGSSSLKIEGPSWVTTRPSFVVTNTPGPKTYPYSYATGAGRELVVNCIPNIADVFINHGYRMKATS